MFQCKCGFETSANLKFPVRCKCGRTWYNKEHYTLKQSKSDFPYDCINMGRKIGKRKDQLCGCPNAFVPVFECKLHRKCVRSKYKSGSHKEQICLYCDDYKCSTEQTGNQSI